MNKEIMNCNVCGAYFNVIRNNKCCGISYIDEYYEKYPEISIPEVIEEAVPETTKKVKRKRRRISPEHRLQIISRDRHTCQDCLHTFDEDELQVHHIVYRSDGGTDIPQNLITLCKVCHCKRHEGEPVHKIMIKSLSLTL